MSNEMYIEKAEKISNDLLRCVFEDGESWKLVKNTDDVQIYSKPSPDTKGNMFKCETILNASPAKLLATVDPTKPYRIQWDEFLAELKVEAQLTESVYLIYHGTKSMLGGMVSARDSLDAVKIGQKENYYFVAAGTVDHANYPPRQNSVRIRQYSCGYVIFPVDGTDDKARFVMVMNTDMKMNNVANFLVEPVKPMLLLEKIKNLRRGLATLDIKY